MVEQSAVGAGRERARGREPRLSAGRALPGRVGGGEAENHPSVAPSSENVGKDLWTQSKLLSSTPEKDETLGREREFGSPRPQLKRLPNICRLAMSLLFLEV